MVPTEGAFVIGRVALWGRVIVSEHGYRGEHGYPEELWLVDGTERQGARLRTRYGVPCHLMAREDYLDALTFAEVGLPGPFGFAVEADEDDP